MRTLFDVLVGVAALVVLQQVVFAAGGLLYQEPPVGADLGSGLLAFAAVVVISGVWAFVASRRASRAVVGLWLAIAVIFSVASTAMAQPLGSGFDTEVFAADLTMLAPVVFLLVAVPAALGLGASQLRKANRPVVARA